MSFDSGVSLPGALFADSDKVYEHMRNEGVTFDVVDEFDDRTPQCDLLMTKQILNYFYVSHSLHMKFRCLLCCCHKNCFAILLLVTFSTKYLLYVINKSSVTLEYTPPHFKHASSQLGWQAQLH